MTRTHVAYALTLVLSTLGLGASCKRAPAAPGSAPGKPSLRVYVVTNVAGALEPCGCVRDMLGGVDHAAALVQKRRGGAGASLFVGAGPMFFLDPVLGADRSAQQTWKAEALAESLGDMGLAAWAPGANDWAAGASALATLREKSRASLLAGNLSGVAGAEATRVVEVAGTKVGIAGVSDPRAFGKPPAGVRIDEPGLALEKAAQALDTQGAKIKIALLALPRGEALRLAERTTGFQLVVVGKPYESGDTNDGATPATLLGGTLVVQTSNHLQSVAVVDLYLRDHDYTFEDGTGLAQEEKRESLTRRIAELESRIAQGSAPGSGVRPEDLSARRSDLEQLRRELGKLAAPALPEGSFFRYSLELVRESEGVDAAVSERMKSYYRRVNEHNKTAFADRRPAPVPEGKAGYIGSEKCGVCHPTQLQFWASHPHTRAYEPLERQEKQFNLDCVSCHVTGYDKPGGSTVTFVEGLKGVQCEVCHGPGSLHSEHTNVKEYLTKPERSFCASECHHPPHVNTDWNVEEAWKHILGPGHGEKKQ
jgi:hypothetical protein